MEPETDESTEPSLAKVALMSFVTATAATVGMMTGFIMGGSAKAWLDARKAQEPIKDTDEA